MYSGCVCVCVQWSEVCGVTDVCACTSPHVDASRLSDLVQLEE